jgi:hypothetical protein
MKKYLLLILTIFLTTLTSCELFYSQKPYTINLMTIALDYENNNDAEDDLTGTINDAKEIEKAFREISERQQVDFNSYNYYQIGLSADTATINDPLYPSKSNILTALDNLVLLSNDNTITIIFYSGHGIESNGSWVLGKTNNIASIALSVEEIYNAIKDINGKTLIISDSCYSGNFYKDSAYTISDYNFTFADAFEKFIGTDSKYDTEDIYILSASQYFEVSYESSDRGHGYFTYELLNGLGWNHNSGTIDQAIPPAAKNNILSVDSLVAYIRPEILKYYYTGEIGYQYPQVSGGRFDLVLFKY